LADFIEIDFLPVETKKSGDAITLRYSVNGCAQQVHVVDGGFLATGEAIAKHLTEAYGTRHIDNVVLTHTDQDHVNGLRALLELCSVGRLWMNRPWLYAEELIHRFETYNSVDALRRKLRSLYRALDELETLAIAKSVPIADVFQGANIGPFTVLAPSRRRYLELIVESDKTPESSSDGFLASLMDGVTTVAKAASKLVVGAWAHEYFPPSGTSSENEMSVVQFAQIDGRNILLTGDVGRDGLTEAADYLNQRGVVTPPSMWCFQVPHHGGRHNVDTEILDRWLGPTLAALPETTSFNAICSSAKEDEDHPKNSVVRAMMHRGGHFCETEGRLVNLVSGRERRLGLSNIPQRQYPTHHEE
jgi:beta-lactamase superfamily II metal-dependent hydrolase